MEYPEPGQVTLVSSTGGGEGILNDYLDPLYPMWEGTGQRRDMVPLCLAQEGREGKGCHKVPVWSGTDGWGVRLISVGENVCTTPGLT